MGVREDFFNAVHARNEALARELLRRHGLDPNLLERSGLIGGTHALALAARFGMHGLMADLVTRGADARLYGDGLAPIHMAADARAIGILVAAGADVNAPWKREGVDMARGTTALHTAARDNRPELIEALLKAGGDPNVRDRDGFTPLHYAASRSEIVARQLLAAGAGDQIRTASGLTARELLEQHQPGLANELGLGSARLADQLLKGGAQPNAIGTGPKVRPVQQTTPLHLAAMYDNPEMASLLLEYGANPNALDGKGLAPVHYATGQSRALLEALVKGGADLQLKTSEGKTAADLLAQFGPDLGAPAVAMAAAPAPIVARASESRPAPRATAHAVPIAGAQQMASVETMGSSQSLEDDALLVFRKGPVQNATQDAAQTLDDDAPLVLRKGPVQNEAQHVGQTQSTAQSRAEAAKAAPVAGKSLLGGQFVGNEKGEYVRPGEKRVALVDAGGQIELKDRESDTVAAGVELAKEKGWPSIEVGGGTRFRREAWLAAAEAGIAVIGYEPSQKDHEELERRRKLNSGGSLKAGPAVPTQSATPSQVPAAAASDAGALDASLEEAKKAALAAGKKFMAADLHDRTYASKVFGETEHHVLLMADGRANTATAIEKSKLQGIPVEVGKMLKVRFKDGQATAQAKTEGKKLSLSR